MERIRSQGFRLVHFWVTRADLSDPDARDSTSFLELICKRPGRFPTRRSPNLNQAKAPNQKLRRGCRTRVAWVGVVAKTPIRRIADFLSAPATDAGCATLSLGGGHGKDAEPRVGTFVDRFARELVRERIDNGHIDVASVSVAEMETLSRQIGRRVAEQLGNELTDRRSESHSHDDCCPNCGRECEAIKQLRSLHTIDGETKVVELRSFCPKCRRSSFPCP